MSYQNQPRGDRSNMVAAALLAVSAGACLGAVFSYGATPSSLYTAPATAVRVNSAAAQASVVPNMVNARMQRAAVADVYQADASDAQYYAQPQFATAAPTAPWVGAAAFGVLVSAVGAVVMILRNRTVATHEEQYAMLAAAGKKEATPWVMPKLEDALANDKVRQKAEAMSTQLPTFWEMRDMLAKVPKSQYGEVFDSLKGSTGTLLRAAETEEYYAMTWTSPKTQIYELPTGGAAEMDEGLNLMYFARKEQCLALGTQLRTKFKPRIENYAIYRVFPNGETQYLHPADGVFPEKVNAGRVKANHNPRSIGQNVNPAATKFTGSRNIDMSNERIALMAAAGKKEAVPFVTPTLNPSAEAEAKAKAQSTQLPIYWDTRDQLSKVPKSQFGEVFDSFKGSTGTLLRAAETEEKYAITWTSPKAQIYELPTGGAAMMDEGENMMYFARKEQCLALGSQLRTAFKPRMEDFQIYRIFPNGEVQYLHPKDGVFPEKVNAGRSKANHNARSIGKNGNPVNTKFTGETPSMVGTEGPTAMYAASGKKAAPAEPWVEPTLSPSAEAEAKAVAQSTQLPIYWDTRDQLSKVPKSQFGEVFDSFKGSTGTLLRAAETEEKYAITWTSPKAQIYELPTGGAAMMDEGENMMYFARKEQCLALGSQLRTAFKPRMEDFKIYRIFPNGEVQYLHPKDGVFPEKVNAGRSKANHNARSIGKNGNPVNTKFTGETPSMVGTEGPTAMYAASGKKAAPAEPWVEPTLSPSAEAEAKAVAQSTQLPIYWDTRDQLSKVPKSQFGEVFDSFKGSTGTLLRAAETEEKYAITWTSPKAQIYELPTGGAAMMDEGENMMYFARKEQCLALGSQLRTAFKPRMEDFKIYRIFPNGEVQYLHPKDGVFPEKVNEGRTKVNHNARNIGSNVDPVATKFTGTTPKEL